MCLSIKTDLQKRSRQVSLGSPRRVACVDFFCFCISTISQTTNFRPFQTERIADDNFKIDKNDRKFSVCVENTVEKGEIAHNEQFLVFPRCF